MKIRPKTFQRLAILAAGGVVLAAGGASLIAVRAWQVDRRLAELREAGLAAADEGRPNDTVEALRRYVRQRRDDADVVLVYARALRDTENGEGTRSREAVNQFRAYRALRPDDTDVAIELLELMPAVGLATEAADLARELRSGGRLSPAQDAIAARQLAVALLALDPDSTEAEEVLAQGVREAPSDYGLLRLHTALLLKRGRPEEAFTAATAAVAANPGDLRFEVIRVILDGVVAQGTDAASVAAAKDLIAQVRGMVEAHQTTPGAPNPFADPIFIETLLSLADDGRDPRLGITALRRSLEAGEPRSAVPLARRLYTAGAHDEIAALVPENLDTAAADVLGYAALTAGAERRAELTAALERRERDSRAAAWAHFLPAQQRLAAGEPAAALPDFRLAVSGHPSEPVFHFALGDALERTGQKDAAREAWRLAARLAPRGWTDPLTRVVASLLGEDRHTEALAAAEAAIAAAPDRAAVYVSWLNAVAALSNAGGAAPQTIENAARTLDRIDADATLPPEFFAALLPARLTLYAQTRPEAFDALLAALPDQPGIDDPETLARVLAALRGIGAEPPPALLDRLQDADANPQILALTAQRLIAEGRADEAVALFAQPPAGAGAAWHVTRVRTLEAAADSRDDAAAVVAEWKRLADEHPADVQVLNAVLDSALAATDRNLVESTIERLRAAAGLDRDALPIRVRLARARALVADKPTARDRDAAIGILDGVVAASPSHIGARVQLAQVLLMSDEQAGITPEPVRAAENLIAAANASAGRQAQALLLQAATVQQQRGDVPAARATLLRVAADQTADAGVVLQAAALLLRQGDAEQAATVFSRVVAMPDAPAAARAEAAIGAARALETQGRDAQAREAYRTAAAAGFTTPEAARTAAAFFARTGDRETETAILAALDQLGLPPGEAQYHRALHAATAGRPDEAESLIRAAIDAAPENAEYRAEHVRMLLRAGRADDAEQALAAAIEAVPDDPTLQVMRTGLSTAKAGDSPESFEAMARALEASPGGARAAEAVRRLARLEAEGRDRDHGALLALAAEYPDVLALQTLVGRRLLDGPDADPDAAGTHLLAAARRFPASPDLAQLATVALAAAGRHEEVLDAANLWRQRAPGAAPAADLAMAESLIRLGQRQRARGLAAAHLPAAVDNPSSDIARGWLAIHAQLAALEGSPDTAFQTLRPLLDDPGITAVWIATVAGHLRGFSDAQKWLGEIERRADGDPAMPLRIATAWRAFGQRVPEAADSAFAAAAAILDRLPDPEDPQAILARAELDLARAERARRAGDTAAANAFFAECERAYVRVFERLGENANPALLLSAATAAEARDDLRAAADHYRRVLALPSARGFLAAVARNNLAYAISRSDPSEKDLEAALALVEEAVAAAPRAEFLHTRGQILSARGDLAGAAAAYREALRANPDLIDALVSLAAHQLKSSDPAARLEGERLLRRAEDLAAAGADLAPHLRRQMDELRPADAAPPSSASAR